MARPGPLVAEVLPGWLHPSVQQCLLPCPLTTFLGQPMLILTFPPLLLWVTLATVPAPEPDGHAPRSPSPGCLLGGLHLQEANSDLRWHLTYMPAVSKQRYEK